MLFVISDNKTKMRNYVDSIRESDSGTIFHLDTRSQLLQNKDVDCPDLPFKLAEQAAQFHYAQPLKIETVANGKKEIALIDSYQPSETNQTDIRLKHATGFGRLIVDLPIEAIDFYTAERSRNRFVPDAKFGHAIDLSNESALHKIRKDYEVHKSRNNKEITGLPLHITTEGVQAILRQACAMPSHLIKSRSTEGMREIFDEKAGSAKIRGPINPRIVTQIYAQHTVNGNTFDELSH